MKKFLNKPEDIMDELLVGMEASNRQILNLKPGTHQMMRRVPKEQGKVKIIIGNGGGHEPGSLGWVGHGMFDMVSMGDIFAAQSGKKLFASMQDIDDGSPMLLAIANHAGDVMNGQLAVRQAKKVGMQVEGCIFCDDIASAPKEMPEERRGLTGMFFGVKYAGAAAEEGASLEECVRAFNKANTYTRSISVALSGCTHPQTGMTMMELDDDLVNIGAGVHGEAGPAVMAMTNCKNIVAKAMDLLLEDMPMGQGDEVVMLINGMGGTTLMEQYIFYQDARKYLEDRNVAVYDGVATNLFTTQEAGGVTISLCKMDEEMKKWWDAPCRTVAYTNR